MIRMGAALLLALAIAGCSSRIGVTGAIDASRYSAMTCAELNSALGDAARNISATAIDRGKVSKWKAPSWAPGGERALTAIQDRQTTKIERLRNEQAAIEAARKHTCSG